MEYCRDALKLLGEKVICGKSCPIFTRCPRLILEDNALDADETRGKAIDKAIKAMLGAMSEKIRN